MKRTFLSALTALILSCSVVSADELEILRSRFLTARPGAVRAVTTVGDSLPLRLFDDAQFNARLRGIEDSRHNGFVWRGDLDGIPGSWVVLVESDGCLVGTVATDETFFRILCLGDSRHVIEEVRPFARWIDDTVVDPPSEAAPFATTAGMMTQTLEPDEVVEMDVLVVYTKKAAKDFFRRYNTGFTNKNKAIKAYIQLAIAIGNTALENSEVNLRWRLVNTKRVKWRGADSGNPFYSPECGDGTSTGPKCGRRTGTGKADCARSLNNTREFFAAVYPCKVDCGN